jgi:hypothetical protein
MTNNRWNPKLVEKDDHGQVLWQAGLHALMITVAYICFGVGLILFLYFLGVV